MPCVSWTISAASCHVDFPVPARFAVIDVLRQFLPPFLKTKPPLSPAQRRAIWAITHCRTAALGGYLFDCKPCGRQHFAFHSCNHKACPQCGSAANVKWVQREQRKLVNATYFLVTFTLPSELRCLFFGPHAKEAFDLFFAAVSGALSEKLATDKGLRAAINGFTAVLHTWNQQIGFHPHIHCLVPGVGLNAHGKLVRVKNPEFLVHLKHLQGAFRQHFYRLLKEHNWQVDRSVWEMDWGVHIQAAGSGRSALKYLGTYVARTAINDARLVNVTDSSVTFHWKNRDQGNRRETSTVTGVEFVTRYLRHVLPRGLRSIRYYGFCHSAAKANRLRVQFHTGLAVEFGAAAQPDISQSTKPLCACCGKPMRLVLRLIAAYKERGPPSGDHSTPVPRTTSSLAA
jgi:Putative transposase/Transposase zinc-binding domain